MLSSAKKRLIENTNGATQKQVWHYGHVDVTYLTACVSVHGARARN